MSPTVNPAERWGLGLEMEYDKDSGDAQEIKHPHTPDAPETEISAMNRKSHPFCSQERTARSTKPN